MAAAYILSTSIDGLLLTFYNDTYVMSYGVYVSVPSCILSPGSSYFAGISLPGTTNYTFNAILNGTKRTEHDSSRTL